MLGSGERQGFTRISPGKHAYLWRLCHPLPPFFSFCFRETIKADVETIDIALRCNRPVCLLNSPRTFAALLLLCLFLSQ